jgi:hypothetical protein
MEFRTMNTAAAQPDTEMNERPKVQNIVQMKFPITWLIGACVVVLSGLLALYVTFLDYGRDIKALTNTVNALNAKTDTRDDRITAIVQSTIEMKASQSGAEYRLQRAEGDVKELRNTVEELRRNQRWMPK